MNFHECYVFLRIIWSIPPVISAMAYKVSCYEENIEVRFYLSHFLKHLVEERRWWIAEETT